ncbi:MAG: calcium-binding protein [Solirubrobacteraceae bacterium]
MSRAFVVVVASLAALPVSSASAASLAASFGDFLRVGSSVVGENNVIKLQPVFGVNDRLEITDTAGINDGNGCTTVSATKVSCAAVIGNIAVALGSGNDTLTGASLYFTTLTAAGEDGNDKIYGNSADDSLYGGEGSDQLYGLAGDDTLGDAFPPGQAGFKTSQGGGDFFYGGANDDTLLPSVGGDYYSGEAGFDTVDYSARSTPQMVTVGDGQANDGDAGEGDNVNDAERLLGGSAADKITGGGEASRLVGNAGNDTLVGGSAADVLIGGAETGESGSGNDTLDGGRGADDMRGGDGTDSVTYATRSGGVTISPDDVADDGEPGEADNVRSDVETLISGAGDDVFKVRDGRTQTIVCGAGTDAVTADSGDAVDDSCEVVDRPATMGTGTDTGTGSGDGTGTGTGTETGTTNGQAASADRVRLRATKLRRDRRGRVIVRLRCTGGTSGCAGTVKLTLRRKRVGSALYVIRSGRSRTIHVPLARRARRQPRLGIAFSPAIGKSSKKSTLTVR